jgi:hypothetical protein
MAIDPTDAELIVASRQDPRAFVELYDGPSLAGALDPDGHRLIVVGGPARSTSDLNRSLSSALAAESVKRCYTVAGLQALVRQRVAPTGRKVSFKVGEALGGGKSLTGSTGARYAAGCAIVEKVGPDPNGYDMVALIDKKG